MAESKLENLPVSDDKFRCPICLEEVRNPKYLPCYHTFCKSCIQTYISSTAACSGDNSPKTIQCPVCRKSVQAPSVDYSSEEWACSLPEDKLILSMSVDSDRSENKFCMFCQRNDKTVHAKHWCKTCIETICDDCKSFHSYVPMLQGHKIVSISNIVDLKNDIEIDEPCLIHKGKYIEAFCQDHDKLCCSLCFFTNHRFCQKVEFIGDTDVPPELELYSSQISPTFFNDVLMNLNDVKDEYRKTIANLTSKKQEIYTFTEMKVEEIKSILDQAHNQWTKQFEQKHSDAVGNIEIALDEVKRFATAVQEAKSMLQKVLENGSTKQIFFTRFKLRHQIVDHVNRLRELNIWDVVYDYNQPDTDFLHQVCDDQMFKNVNLLKKPTAKIDTVLRIASHLDNEILRRQEMMSRRDWMEIKVQKVSGVRLPSMVYYGLFVCDTKVLLSVEKPPSLQIYDISDTNARCVLTYPCSATPFGLCLSGESIDKVYVSFETHVEHFQIEISNSVVLKKLETIQLKIHMKGISRGSTMMPAGSNAEIIVCTSDFTVKHRLKRSKVGDRPFISASLKSNNHAFITKNEVVVVNQENKEVLKRDTGTASPRGLAFDLQDNILICIMNNKLRQIKKDGFMSRDIDLPGIKKSYNVVLHPTGEKLLILDLEYSFCVYNVL